MHLIVVLICYPMLYSSAFPRQLEPLASHDSNYHWCAHISLNNWTTFMCTTIAPFLQMYCCFCVYVFFSGNDNLFFYLFTSVVPCITFACGTFPVAFQCLFFLYSLYLHIFQWATSMFSHWWLLIFFPRTFPFHAVLFSIIQKPTPLCTAPWAVKVPK